MAALAAGAVRFCCTWMKVSATVCKRLDTSSSWLGGGFFPNSALSAERFPSEALFILP
jgi:hypothetical protein